MLGIEIGVQSVVGKGSLFWLHVPLSCNPSDSSGSNTLLEHRKQEQSGQVSGNRDTHDSEIIEDDDSGHLSVEGAIFPGERDTYDAVYPAYATLIQQRHRLASKKMHTEITVA
jgi:hypothetical protein